MYTYFVYILASKRNGTLYTGVTNNLVRRLEEHKSAKNPNSFTSKYGVKMLVYFEEFSDITQAILREKQIKGGSRKNKIALIERENKTWKDLSEEES